MAKPPPPSTHARYLGVLEAREQLTFNVFKVMADHKLDAIVHKTVEIPPTLIKDGINPPYPSSQRCADAEHVPGLRRLDDGAIGIHEGQSAGRHHVLRPALQRSAMLKARLCLRAGDEASPKPPKTTPALPK